MVFGLPPLNHDKEKDHVYKALKDQLDLTLSNIDHGTIGREDRVFLTHVLEEIHSSLPTVETGKQIDVADTYFDLLGSTQELIEDGLGD